MRNRLLNLALIVVLALCAVSIAFPGPESKKPVKTHVMGYIAREATANYVTLPGVPKITKVTVKGNTAIATVSMPSINGGPWSQIKFVMVRGWHVKEWCYYNTADPCQKVNS